ncbi:MAG: polysaccharide biosynthesis/export family protein [Rhodomicrobium sp.]
MRSVLEQLLNAKWRYNLYTGLVALDATNTVSNNASFLYRLSGSLSDAITCTIVRLRNDVGSMPLYRQSAIRPVCNYFQTKTILPAGLARRQNTLTAARPRAAAYVTLISILASTLFMAMPGVREVRAAEASQPEEAPADHATAKAGALRIGDKVNFSLYERIERQEDKWSSPQQRLPDLSRSFLQRSEVSGERTIQDDGTISLPFIGQIPVAGLTNSELEQAVAKAFEAVFHRPAFVTVLSVEHNPIYIVGPVKNPGSYKYTADMTALHAIALAGGIERPQQDSWQAVEAIHEEAKIESARTNASRLLARVAVLRAERDEKPVTIPPRLAQILGEAEAEAIISDEKALRSLVLTTRQTRETGLRAAIESAKNEIEIANDRITPLENIIKLRNDRLKAMTSLSSTGIASRAQLVEVQATLFDVESRKEEALASLAVAKQKLQQAEQESAQFQLQNKTQTENEIAAASREVIDNIASIDSGKETLRTVKSSLANRMKSQKTDYTLEVLRKTSDGTKLIQANDLTELEPGDLVRVKPPPAETPAQTE